MTFSQTLVGKEFEYIGQPSGDCPAVITTARQRAMVKSRSSGADDSFNFLHGPRDVPVATSRTRFGRSLNLSTTVEHFHMALYWKSCNSLAVAL